MKKHLLLYLFVALTFYSRSQCVSAFYDGFESGSYTPTWTLGAGLSSASVTTGNPYAGNFKVEGIGGTNAHLTGLSTAFTAATPNYMSWAVYPTGTVATNYVVAGDNAVTASNCMVFCYWQGGTNIRFVSSSTQIYSCTPNAWYFIELKNINYTTHVFDIYINNVLIVTSFPFRSPTVNNLSRVHLYNFNSGTGIWDDVKVGNGFSASALTNSVSCFGGSNGSATVSVSGSPGPYTYTWTSPAVSTTSVATSLTFGTYTCSVSDGVCTASTSISINEPSQILVSATQTNVNCFSACNAVANAVVTGGVGPYTYSWSPTGGPASMATNLCAGNYTCFVTDANACTTTQAYTISQPAQLLVTTGQTNIDCVNAIASATANVTGGSGPPYTYSWSPTGGNAAVASPLSPANYTCTITDANLCTVISTVNIISNTTAPSVSIAGPSVICTGQTATLVASGANTYTWNTSSNASSIAVSPTVNTTYTVTGTNTSNGCVATATVTQNVSLCTGITTFANNASQSINVYPNPNNGTFNILFTENGKYNLVNAFGQVVREIILNQTSNNTVEFSGLASGIYYIAGNNVKIKIIVTN
ncbi:MAG: T9SS type A sorting domain-containing protein [Bacteroidota bacterium]|nr:T9SS type A sorting domain-containing protein [Bacteroidota bacterium]